GGAGGNVARRERATRNGCPYWWRSLRLHVARALRPRTSGYSRRRAGGDEQATKRVVMLFDKTNPRSGAVQNSPRPRSESLRDRICKTNQPRRNRPENRMRKTKPPRKNRMEASTEAEVTIVARSAPLGYVRGGWR